MVPQPEQKARKEIDQLLIAAGWSVCDPDKTNIHGARGVAIRDFPLKSTSPLAGEGGGEGYLNAAEAPADYCARGRTFLERMQHMPALKEASIVEEEAAPCA